MHDRHALSNQRLIRPEKFVGLRGGNNLSNGLLGPPKSSLNGLIHQIPPSMEHI